MEKLLLLFCLISIEPFEIDQEITKTPEVLETLRRIKENPIDINDAKKIELLLIPYLDIYLAERIINYREEHLFESKEELLLIDGITPYLFDRIENLVKIDIKKAKRKNKGIDFLSRFETKLEGESRQSEDKTYSRTTIPYKDVLINGICEKDYDEEDYLDYYALSIYIPEKLIIGDYDLDLGMGIILGKPDFFYRSAGTIPGERGFSPHLSTYEEDYLSGIALQYNRFMLFGSYNKTSRLGKEKLLGGSYRFSSIRITGGAGKTERNGKFGIVSFYADKALAGNLFRLEVASGGNDLKESRKNISYSMGIDNGKGLKAIYVNIKDSLPTIRNSPFYKDEEAFYISYTKKLTPDLSAGVFTELSRRISSMESFDRIAEIHLSWEPLKNLQLHNRIKTQEGQNNGRFEVIHKVKDITFRNRFEVLNDSDGSGFLAYTSFRYSKNYIFEGRLILYETDNWESRIYEYENDLPGKFTIKQLYGSGKRLYLIIGEKILPLKLYLKWGIDLKNNPNHEIGLAFYL